MKKIRSVLLIAIICFGILFNNTYFHSFASDFTTTTFSDEDLYWIDKLYEKDLKGKQAQFINGFSATKRQSGIDYAIKNAVALYDEAINNPPNKSRKGV